MQRHLGRISQELPTFTVMLEAVVLAIGLAMDATAVIGSAATVLSFLTFVAIVAWAYSRRRQRQFEDAANAPFALPDDGGPLDAPAAADGPGARR